MADSPAEQRSEHSSRKLQFSLRWALFLLFVVSILFALASQFPRPAKFVGAMAALLLVPLVLTAVLRAPFVWCGVIADERRDRRGPLESIFGGPLRLLQTCGTAQPPSFAAACATAVISMLVLVGIWPVLRELGLNGTLFALQPLPQYTWSDAARSMSSAFTDPGYWYRCCHWELWAVSRWWLLFGGITLAWIAASVPLQRWLPRESASQTLCRMIAFAPWLMVLEIAFLIGVWLNGPATVPEPSTGFVVGIFSWDLWHWDCWLDRGWLVRGALPTLLAGTFFFRYVIRWRWLAAVIAAKLLIPPALLLSIACMVAYRHGR